MKYLLIIGLFFLSEAYAGTGASADSTDVCAHSTEDSHVVSNSAYNRLLTRLTQSSTNNKKRAQQRQKGPARGQR